MRYDPSFHRTNGLILAILIVLGLALLPHVARCLRMENTARHAGHRCLVRAHRGRVLRLLRPGRVAGYLWHRQLDPDPVNPVGGRAGHALGPVLAAFAVMLLRRAWIGGARPIARPVRASPKRSLPPAMAKSPSPIPAQCRSYRTRHSVSARQFRLQGGVRA